MKPLPYSRVGLCCGEKCRHKLNDVVLYRIGDAYRYRCKTCFRKETGHQP